MYEEEINRLPVLVKNGELSQNVALNKILTVIYTNPHRFCLGQLSDDDRSDFFLFLYTKLRNIFTNYNSKGSPFIVYLYSCISLELSAWNRMRYRNSFSADCTNFIIEQLYEEEVFLYEQHEISLCPPPALLPKQLCTASYHPITQYKLTDTKKFLKNDRDRKAALVLALKSCYYINDNDIDRICCLCGCNKGNLTNTIQTLKSSLTNKAERVRKYKERRDISFFFHRRYSSQLKNLPFNSYRYEQLSRKYERQSKLWKKKNDFLQNSKSRVTPTNKAVAEVLGLCERQVCYYIAYAKEMAKKGKSRFV